MISSLVRNSVADTLAVGGIQLVTTSDPRDNGRAGNIGDMLLLQNGASSVALIKRTTSDYGWAEIRDPYPFLTPTSATRVASLTGLTPTGGRKVRGPGDVQDFVGSAHLPRAATDPYFARVDGYDALFMQAASSYVRADVHDPGTGSFIAVCLCAIIETSASIGLIGRVEAAAAKGFMLYWVGGTGLQYLIRDTNAHAVTANLGQAVNPLSFPDRMYMFGIQVDRTNARMYVRMSRGGALITGDAINISTVTDSLTAASQVYGSGNLTSAFLGGNAYAYDLYFTGAQCEGSNKLDDIFAGLGAE